MFEYTIMPENSPNLLFKISLPVHNERSFLLFELVQCNALNLYLVSALETETKSSDK